MAVGELGGHCGWLRGASRPLWTAVEELGGHCGWLYGSLEAVLDGYRGAWRPLWMA